jgi:hypothetical protein
MTDHFSSEVPQPPADSPVVLAHVIAEAIRDIAANGHDCLYDIIGVSYPEPVGEPSVHPRLRTRPPNETLVLIRCRICNMPEVQVISGHWTESQIISVGKAKPLDGD